MSASSPFVIAVAGSGSNTGKTTLACAIIERRKLRFRVGALKISTATDDYRCARTGLPCGCLAFDGPMEVVTDESVILTKGKDTEAFSRAGADPVWWLKTTREHSAAAYATTVEHMHGVEVVLVEGAPPLRGSLADFSILIARGDGTEPKAGWFDLVPAATALALTTSSGTGGVPVLVDRCRAAGLAEDAWVGEFGGTGQTLPDARFWSFLDARLAARTSHGTAKRPTDTAWSPTRSPD